MTDLSTNSTLETTQPGEAQFGDYFALLKPRVMTLVVFTALVGLLAAASCRNATLVRVPGRLLQAEQSDASADSLRLRSIPCAHDTPHCAFDNGRPGALLPPTSPRCAERHIAPPTGAARPAELLSTGNLRLLLTPDARLRFGRRSAVERKWQVWG